MPAQSIRTATPADADVLGHIIGRAFAEDPVNLWALCDAPTIDATFHGLAVRHYVPLGVSTIADGGGALWLAPGQKKELSVGDTLALARILIGGAGLRFALRAEKLDRTLCRLRPKAPHHYLFALGVDKQRRGQGLGEALLRDRLTKADADGLGAYLENSNPRNTPLYERVGFRVVETLEVGGGCPPLWRMWREPGA